MDIRIQTNGFSNQRIALRPRSLLLFGPKLILNGVPAKRRQAGYSLTDDLGQDVQLQFRARFLDPVPDLVLGDQRIEVLPPLRAHEHFWLCIPICMITFGGLLGGFCGALALNCNYHAFRRIRHPVLKYVLTGIITASAPLVYFGICIVIVHAIGLGHR